jgi:phosphopantetheine adenylyltransferase
VYGPTSTDPDVQGIIFSEESRKGAVSGKFEHSLGILLTVSSAETCFAVAQIRKERNLSTLETFVISVISPEQVIDTDIVSKDEMLKVKMGSTQIRRRIRERMQQGEA